MDEYVPDKHLSKVYAVRVGERDGVPLYEPRSKAAPTETMPKLYASRRDAERKARALGDVVVFRLCSPSEPTYD